MARPAARHTSTIQISPQPGQTLSLTQRQCTCKQTTRWVATTFLRAGYLDSPLPLGTELGFCGARSNNERQLRPRIIVAEIPSQLARKTRERRVTQSSFLPET